MISAMWYLLGLVMLCCALAIAGEWVQEEADSFSTGLFKEKPPCRGFGTGLFGSLRFQRIPLLNSDNNPSSIHPYHCCHSQRKRK